MRLFRTSGRRLGLFALSASVLIAGSVGIAIAATSSPPPSNGMGHGHGVNEFGMTKAYYKGTRLHFTYTKGYYCDTSVRSTASSECEAGANFKRPPAKHFDPLYITVPLGFNRPMANMDCPSGLVCVDHPGTIDMRRLEPALKPLYPSLTDKQLRAALANFAVPGHDHFITDLNKGKPEWWDVQIVGVTSPTVYKQIRAHQSYSYIQKLITKKNKNVLGPIPTNLFLFFAAK
jgi:hypothetical protein